MGVEGRKKFQFLTHQSTGAPSNLSKAVQEVKFNNQVTEQPSNDQQHSSHVKELCWADARWKADVQTEHEVSGDSDL